MTELQEARVFLLRLGIFILPLVILLGVPLVILERSGELDSVPKVLASQMSGEVLYGNAYSDVTPYYKLQATSLRRPAILVLGASTVMQFSSKFFIDPNIFFNAGGAVAKMSDFSSFMSLLPNDAKPKILIIGIPQFYFIRTLPSPDTRSLTTALSGEEKFFSSWDLVWRDLFLGKIQPLKVLTSQDTIGLQASMNRNGFFSDGSYSWGAYRIQEVEGVLSQEQARAHERELQEFIEGSEYLNGGPEPSEESLRELDAFLTRMEQEGIHVAGFLPPSFTHKMYTLLSDPRHNAGYLAALSRRLEPIFAAHGGTFFDFSDNHSFGGSDDELYDSNHATRKAYARMLVIMAKQDPMLRKEVDVRFLQERIRASTSTLDIF